LIEPVILSIGADLASIASLLITAFVAIQLRSIKRSILARVRIPEVIRDLEGAAEGLRGTLKEWPSHELEANGMVQRIDGILINFMPKLLGAEKRKLSEPHVLIKQRTSIIYRFRPPSQEQRLDAMWNVYNSLVGAIEMLQQRNKDNKKRV
jgi:hypothetical protein